MSFVLLGILNSQAGAGAIDPADLNPDLWLDASDASTITESGGSVSQWDNKGSLSNFTQATSANQPTTGANTLNGLNVIDFASDHLNATSTNEYKILHDGTVYFFAFVGKATGSDDLQLAWGTESDGTVVIGQSFGIDDRSSLSRTGALRYAITNGSSSVINVIDNNQFPMSQFNLASGLVDPGNATAADRLEYYLDDGTVRKENSSTGTPSTSNPNETMSIGSSRAVGDFSGSIAELIVVSGANATEENRAGVVTYLNDKWSVF